MFINSQVYIALLAALSTIAFARPNPQKTIVITITTIENQPPPPTSPAVVNHQVDTNPPIASSTAANSPPTNPPPATSGNSKRGLAYNSTSPSLDIFNPYPKITWGHSWAPVDFDMPSQIEFVATLTDLYDDTIRNWEDGVKKALARGSSNPKYLLAFNEPDQPGARAQMDPGAAAAAYQKYMNQHSSSSVKLGAPSVTNGVVNGMGLTYLANFLSACNGKCIIDFIQVHWYGCDNGCPVDTDVQLFKDQMTAAMKAAGDKPLWIPEFGRLGSIADQQAFLDQVLPWLDDPAQAQIERYAYFMVYDGFLTTGGQLNELGKQYASS